MWGSRARRVRAYSGARARAISPDCLILDRTLKHACPVPQGGAQVASHTAPYASARHLARQTIAAPTSIIDTICDH
jgi:hypothetical protein